MKKTSETVVFFGSGPVAAASLKSLNEHFIVEAIVTKPITEQEMSQAAPGVPIQTVSSKGQLSELIASNPFKSRVGIIVDFGIIVEQSVIDYFPLGIVNSHFSLLPKWRGADPITFSVLSGQQETGVSLMLIVEKLDEGPLLAQSKLKLEPDVTTPELTDQLVDLSNHMLEAVLPVYLEGNLVLCEQDETAQPTYSRKLTKEDGQLDWQKPAEQLEREVRAFIGWPSSKTTLAGKEVTITEAHVESGSGQPGKASLDNKQLAVFCASDKLIIDKLKPAGKKEMTGWEFVAGHKDKLI